jgi:hypothetical protein
MPVVARGGKRFWFTFSVFVLAFVLVLVLDSYARMLWERTSMIATFVMRDDCYYYFNVLLIGLTLFELVIDVRKVGGNGE